MSLPTGRPSRGMPKPFQRPSVSVGVAGPKREWRWVFFADLKTGDTLPGVGRVSEVRVFYRFDPPERQVEITGGENNVVIQPAHKPVWAFSVPPES